MSSYLLLSRVYDLTTTVRRKLADWSSDEEDAGTIAGRAKHSRVVVLQGMFTLKELEVDATLLLDLKEDVREECESLGTVTNVVLYDVRPLLSP